jgi:DNA-binding transcriptional ArsR family regulator
MPGMRADKTARTFRRPSKGGSADPGYIGSGVHAIVPSARFDMANFGELVSDPSRVAMLLSLMDGLARPASELAAIAGVARSTASFHLDRLLVGALVLSEAVGRHRYFRLAGEHVADAIEALALHSAPRRRFAARDPAREALSRARTCYKHLAGQLGVAWLALLERQRLIRLRDGAVTLDRRGIASFEDLGLRPGRWPTGKPCLDWTERRHHLGGALGVLLTQHLLTLRWLARRKDGRALRITSIGRAGFAKFGLRDAIGLTLLR